MPLYPDILFVLIAAGSMYAVEIGKRENKGGRGLEVPERYHVHGTMFSKHKPLL